MLRRAGDACGVISFKMAHVSTLPSSILMARRLSSSRYLLPRRQRELPSYVSSCQWSHTAVGPVLSHDMVKREKVAVDDVDVDDDDDDDDDATLEDYEELLLHSPVSDSVGGGDSNGTKAHDDSQEGASSFSALGLVNDILDLLPVDGAGVRLTSITPALDVEAVSKLCGSVRAFVQLFPHRFQCYQLEESDGSLRWYISRLHGVGTAPSLVENNMDFHADDGKKEIPKTPGRVRVELRRAHMGIDETTMRALLEQLQEALPRNEPISTAGLLPTLPAVFQNSIRASGGGLMRLLKTPLAEEYVDLSQDTTLLSIKGILSLHNVPTYHQQPISSKNSKGTALITAAEGYAEDRWDVELDLDEDGSSVFSTDINDGDDAMKPDDDFLRLDNHATATVPHAGLPSTQAVPPAPPKPQKSAEKRKTPPPLKQEGKSSRSLAGKMSTEELLKVHTRVALLRGRRSPSEMLDLFVECIPTFYVPVHRVKVTDDLARVLGPQNTLHKVIKIYSYYFDRDKAADAVRLKATLQHARMGAANALYGTSTEETSSNTPGHRKLQGTDVTRAFPVLQTPLRLKPNAQTTKKTAPETGKAHVDSCTLLDSPLSELFELLGALPYDRYITISEWAETAGIDVSRIMSISKRGNQHHCFLTRKADEGRETTYLWRLRPYWLAPGSTGELGVNDSAEASIIAPNLKPFWIPIDRLFQKLSISEREDVDAAARPYGGIKYWLRRHGRLCWVDETGEKVRKYCASEGLDDFAHIAVLYLQSSLSAEHVKLEDVVQNRSTTGKTTENKNGNQHIEVLRLLEHGLRITQQHVESTAAGNATQENVHHFLARHNQRLDVKVDAGVLWVARRSLFRTAATN